MSRLFGRKDRRMKTKLLKLLVATTMIMLVTVSCAASFPAKEKVAAMTSEDATKALAGKTEQEVHDNWGEPDSFFSGFYGDIYICDDKCIGVYYDFDSKQVTKAACWIRQEPEKEIEGSLRTYYQMSDGTWTCEGYEYQYRLEISGRMPNAAKDSTFVYLSNIEEISFEQAYLAAGISSNSEDYFSPEEALLVDMY